LSELAKTATYTHACAESNGFLTLLSDGERLTGADALGREAGEWMQQATLAIRARVPPDVLRDTIQPFPTLVQQSVSHRELPQPLRVSVKAGTDDANAQPQTLERLTTAKQGL
jgi:Pyridine nucleotide-disulphide oxidoreductase, dimerisation domain